MLNHTMLWPKIAKWRLQLVKRAGVCMQSGGNSALLDCCSRRPRPTRRPDSFFIQPDDQRHHLAAKIGDGNAESIRCGCHALASQEDSPLDGPCRGEFVAQPHKRISRLCGFTPFKFAPHGIDKNRLTKFEILRDQPKVIEILEAAVGHAERDQCPEFSSHYRYDGIGSKMRRRGVQKNGLVDLDSRGRNGVTKTNVDLDRNTRPGDGCRCADPHATILHLLADRRRRQRCDIKRHTVIGDRLRTNGEAFVALAAILMKQKRFTQEFKDEAVRLVLTSGRRQREIARDLGLGHSTLERWLSQARERTVPVAGNETPHKELKRLRRENAILRQERDILKKPQLSLPARQIDETCVHRCKESRISGLAHVQRRSVSQSGYHAWKQRRFRAATSRS